MGCCTSRPTTASPDQATAQTTSQRNPESSAVGPSNGTSNTSSQRGSGNAQRGGGTVRPNKSLRAPSPVRNTPRDIRTGKSLPWTRSQLARERDAFFHTRVTGNPDVWAALKLISEMLRAGDMPGAQGVMDTVGLTCPTGRVKIDRSSTGHKGGVYDDRGVRYEIPGWVVIDPDDVMDDEEPEKDGGEGDSDVADDDGEDVDDEIRAARRDEKGKGRVEDLGETLVIRTRLSDRAKDMNVRVGKTSKVRVLIRRIQEKAGTDAKIKIAYMGKILAEDKTLISQGFKEGDVVNAMVFG